MKKFGVQIFVFLSAIFALSIISYAKLPTYAKVCSAMEDIKGWQVNEKCNGTNMSGTSVGAVVIATKSFKNSDKELELSVVSGMQAVASWGMFQASMSVETNENLLKTMDIQNYRGGVAYDKKAKSGVVYVCLKNVSGQCRVLFSLKFDKIDYKKAVDLVKNYNLKAIEQVF